MSKEEAKTDKELDCSNASRGVWLVKVPKFIAKKWEKGKYQLNVKLCSQTYDFSCIYSQ
jgi:hypothetical protein